MNQLHTLGDSSLASPECVEAPREMGATAAGCLSQRSSGRFFISRKYGDSWEIR